MNDIGSDLLIICMVISLVHLRFQRRPIHFVQSVMLACCWLGLSILAYYNLDDHPCYEPPTWFISVLFGFAYLLYYFIDLHCIARQVRYYKLDKLDKQ